MTKRTIEIQLQNGLEARPVAVLVQVASKYESVIHIQVEGKYLNAKSIMGMMSLALINGEMVTVTAEGSDEAAAIEGLERFLGGGKVELPQAQVAEEAVEVAEETVEVAEETTEDVMEDATEDTTEETIERPEE